MHPVAALAQATEQLDPPYAVVDLDAFDRNTVELVRRADGKPVRLATKSVRCRSLIERALASPGFRGVMAFTLPEALWLADDVDDVLLGYPTVDRAALARLAADDRARERVTLMVDSTEHLDHLQQHLGGPGQGQHPPVRLCLDLDASWRPARGVHVGARRSPVHSPAAARALAEEISRRPLFRLVGVMAYEGQIAGVADDAGPLLRRTGVKAAQRLSAAELRERRAAAVHAVQQVATLELVNGGGTGSLEQTAAEEVVTEVAAGSGLLAPTLFDHYSSFRPEPAAYFALSVVRRPGPDHVTVLGGGWVASGPAGRDRLPTPAWPEGLRLLTQEGAGEVQTPLTGPGTARLAVGDRVWFRHAKAGELAEHVDTLHLVAGGALAGEALTYRGERRTFL